MFHIDHITKKDIERFSVQVHKYIMLRLLINLRERSVVLLHEHKSHTDSAREIARLGKNDPLTTEKVSCLVGALIIMRSGKDICLISEGRVGWASINFDPGSKVTYDNDNLRVAYDVLLVYLKSAVNDASSLRAIKLDSTKRAA